MLSTDLECENAEWELANVLHELFPQNDRVNEWFLSRKERRRKIKLAVEETQKLVNMPLEEFKVMMRKELSLNQSKTKKED